MVCPFFTCGFRFIGKLILVFTQYGEDAAKESGQGGGGGGGGMADIFDLFGGGGGRRAPARERRGEDVVHRLKVTLEELYNGGTRSASCLCPARNNGLVCIVCLCHKPIRLCQSHSNMEK